MSTIKFLSDNLINNSDISLNAGTANAQYPLINLKNESPSIKFRSNEAVIKIQFDMITTRTVDSIALSGDPQSTLGFNAANLRYSATTDFSLSPIIPVTLSSEFNMGLELFNEIDARYWELELIGTTNVEIGHVFIGKQIDLPQQNYSIGSFSYTHNDNSTIRNNEYGQAFVDVRNLQKKLRGRIEYATKEETEILDDMFKFHGRNKPLWVIVDSESGAISDGTFRFSSYGYLEQFPQWQAQGGQHFSCGITIKEAI
jgi:hypothetical protein